MPFEAFQGGAVQNAYIGYANYTQNTTPGPDNPDPFLGTNNLELIWSNTYQPGLSWNTTLGITVGNPVVSSYMDIMVLGAGRTVTLPDATQASIGTNFIISNVSGGAYTVNVLTHDGVTNLQSIAQATQWYFLLTDSSSANGLWDIIQFGAGTSSASATVLAGYGLSAFQDGNPPAGANVLNTSIPVLVSTSAPITGVDNTKRGQLIVYNGLGSSFIVMPNPNNFTQGGPGYYLNFFNNSPGTFTLQPGVGQNFNGSATSFVLNPGTGVQTIWQSTSSIQGTWWCLGNVRTTGVLPIGGGGTGQTTKTAAFDALSPLNATAQLLTYNGTDNVALAAPTRNASGLIAGLTGAVPQWSGNSIVQVRSTALTTATGNIQGTGYFYSTLGVNFTPTYANSQIWVMITINISTDIESRLQLQKITPATLPTPPGLGTPIVVGTAGAGVTTIIGSNSDNTMRPYTIIAQDTSAFTLGLSYTYSVWLSQGSNTNHLYVNTDVDSPGSQVGCSSIAIFEIGGF